MTAQTDIGRIDIKGAEVTFKAPGGGRIEALAATDLVIEPGSFVSLIGPSGCGKSTMLNGQRTNYSPYFQISHLTGK